MYTMSQERWPVLAILMTALIVNSQQRQYYMDSPDYCNQANVIEIENGQSVVVKEKYSVWPSSLASCQMDFQTRDAERHVKIEFNEYYFSGNPPCPVTLNVTYHENDLRRIIKVFNCVAPKPVEIYSESRSIKILLYINKTTLGNNEYQFKILLSTYTDLSQGITGQYAKGHYNYLDKAMVAGIVVGAVLFFVIVFVALFICIRKYKSERFQSSGAI